MTDVVFTGKCEVNGVHITRDQLCDIAQRAGHRVHDKVNPSIDTFVASRFNTTKARAAANYGISASLYADYLRRACEDILNRGREVPSYVPRYLYPPTVQARPGEPDEITINLDGTYSWGGRVFASRMDAIQAIGRANREREGLNAPVRESWRHGRMTYEIDRATGRVYWNDRIVTGIRALSSGHFRYNGVNYDTLTLALDARANIVVDPDLEDARARDAFDNSSPNRTPVHQINVRFPTGEVRWVDAETWEHLQVIYPGVECIGGTHNGVTVSIPDGVNIEAARRVAAEAHSIATPGRRAIIWDDD